jgi:hypothetical protein
VRVIARAPGYVNAMSTHARILARAHGCFNVASGLWPVLHRASFEAVTGPKVDYWLVRTVGGLMVANGAVQLASAGTRDGRRTAGLLGVGTATVLAAVDLAYAPPGRIRRVYLLDAVLEGAWVAAWWRSGERPRP